MPVALAAFSRRHALGLIGAGLALTPARAATKIPPTRFDGEALLHRWSKGDQHEFTPQGQEDLNRWTTMLTLNRYRAVRSGEALAEAANRLLGASRQNGKVLRTNSRPATPASPAEHMIAAVFGRPTFLEASFTRLVLLEGEGLAITYGHRIYGEKVGQPMADWLGANGQRKEGALMGWQDAALIKALRAS